MKSKCIVFPEPMKVDIAEEEVATLKADEILLRAERSLISIGTEMRCLKGVSDQGTNWHDWLQYPFAPGYCTTGTVVEVGKNVANVHVGDRFATQNSHRQYFIDNPNNQFLVPIPSSVSFGEAAWQILGDITQLGVRRADLKLGETVGVIGAGMLGQLVIQYIRAFGARKVIVIDMNAQRLALAKQNGADHVFNGDIADAHSFIEEVTGGKMLDVVYDITGLPKVLAYATTLLRELGKVILLGDNVCPSQQNLGPRVLSNSISILGSFGGRCPEHYDPANPWTWKEMGSLFFDYVMDGRMNVSRMTTDVFAADEAEKVYHWLYSERPDTVGVQFDWSK